MQVKYICPYWGQEGTNPRDFFDAVLRERYDGVEINLPETDDFAQVFLDALSDVRKTRKDFIFVAQQVLSLKRETAGEYIDRMAERLEKLAGFRPDFINSHTGKDYFTFEENCQAIEAAERVARRSGVPVLHEIHRGRFTFHPASLLPYLERFPDLRLTADFSHWCTVSESLLQDQEDIVEKVIPRCHHLHARIGSAQSPQVNDAFAPEWSETFDTFVGWWKKIVAARAASGDARFTICPECGPAPYMPAMPHTKRPLSDQWLTNVRMKDRLSLEFSKHSSR
jgi:hypothetical protein